MEKRSLIEIINTANGKKAGDLIITNGKIVDVYNGVIIEGQDIAVVEGKIAGIGKYKGEKEIDAKGQYILPGLIDGHIHIESAYVSPEEFGRLVVPFGTTTIVADPHEIVNVCGVNGLDYMINAAKNTKLDIKYMIPSCVPATPFENSGAELKAEQMESFIGRKEILGLGEFMDYPGVISAREDVTDKLLVALKENKIIDGHSPGVSGTELNAYIAAGIHTDHECSTVEEMQERIRGGMYVLMREGSACNDLRRLLKGINEVNSRRCLLCSDDRQPKTIFETGHINNHLKICVEEGIDPIVAVQMASLNAAECYQMRDRGGIAPGLRADLVFVEDLKEFQVTRTIISGEEVAINGKYLGEKKKYSIESVKSKFAVGDYNKNKLELYLKSKTANIIEILPEGIVTRKVKEEVMVNQKGCFVFDPEKDIAKIAVIERHNNTGNTGVGLIKGYGIKEGAIAISIAHDSHNIISVGTNDDDMDYAVLSLIKQNGGIVLVKNQKIIAEMPLVIAGIMSDQSGEWVADKITKIHELAYNELKISRSIEPVMTLCFMSLAVIPEIKITDKGLFDVIKFEFISVDD